MRICYAKDDAQASGGSAPAAVAPAQAPSAPHPALAILDEIDTAVEALGIEVRGKVNTLTKQARDTLA